MNNVKIIVHGGAGNLSDKAIPAAKEGCAKAAEIGLSYLLAGATATEAVEAAIKELENNPIFNAGTGSVLTAKGNVEMDALIIDGKDISAGSVAGITTVKNPISVAKLVMEKTPHVLLIGQGAEIFAKEYGIENIDNKDLVTAARIEQLNNRLSNKNININNDINSNTNTKEIPCEGDHDTVGAVAIDCNGNVAAGTSTGGLMAKMPGRVGDSPLIGSGAWADNETGAVSTTGTGEFIMRACLAKTVTDNYSLLLTDTDTDTGEDSTIESHAALKAISWMQERIGGPGAGLIFLSSRGKGCIIHSTERMSYGYAEGEYSTKNIIKIISNVSGQRKPLLKLSNKNKLSVKNTKMVLEIEDEPVTAGIEIF